MIVASNDGSLPASAFELSAFAAMSCDDVDGAHVRVSRMRHMALANFLEALRTPGRVGSQLRDIRGHLLNQFSSSRYARAYRRVRPFTMSGDVRLRGLYDAVQIVTARGVDGVIVECGTARGGSAALLGLAARDSGVERSLWIFDTFEGIPPPTVADPDYDRALPFTGHFRGDIRDVTALMERFDLAHTAQLVKGRFEETVPTASLGPIAVLHIDGDWYQSVKVCLDHLYDQVSPGGIIQIDDYGHWKGARKAVDEFRSGRRLDSELRYVDYTGRQFDKP